MILLERLIKLEQAFLHTANKNFRGKSLILQLVLENLSAERLETNVWMQQREVEFTICTLLPLFHWNLSESQPRCEISARSHSCKALECSPCYTNKHDFRHNSYVLGNIKLDHLSPGQMKTRKGKMLEIKGVIHISRCWGTICIDSRNLGYSQEKSWSDYCCAELSTSRPVLWIRTQWMLVQMHLCKKKPSTVNFTASASQKSFEPLPINIWWLLLQHFVFPGNSHLSMGWCSSSLFKSSIRGDFHLIYGGLVAEHAFFGWGMHQVHWVVNGRNRWEKEELQQCRGHGEPEQRLGTDRKPVMPDLKL